MIHFSSNNCFSNKKYFLTFLLGSTFALPISFLWDLEPRWMLITTIAVLGIGLLMCFASVLSDFILILSIFSLPIMSFGKWFWIENLTEEERGNITYSGTFGIGPIDVLVILQYMSWFSSLFITKSTKLKKFHTTDFFVLWFLLACILSIFGSPQPIYGIGVVTFLLKYIMFYFFLSRNISRRHLPWIIGCFSVTLALEAILGFYQAGTGNLLGVALDKGAAGSALNYQYEVPGIEGRYRATGTCYDSHSFGLFIAMILPFFLVLTATPWVKGGCKIYLALSSIVAFILIYLSFSRSTWVAVVIAMVIGLIILFTIWKETELLPQLVTLIFLILIFSPLIIFPLYERFANSPYGTLSTRFDQYIFAIRVWSEHFFFGYGPGNWLNALRYHDFLWQELLLVHNVMLLTAAETGLFGLFGFLGVLAAAIISLMSVISNCKDIIGRFALATLIAISTSILAGMTDPTLREPNTFAVFWLMISLAVALGRMFSEQRNIAKFTVNHLPAPAEYN